MSDFDIDEWEDMLPVERDFEKKNKFFGGGGGGGGSGPSVIGVILWLLVMIYNIVDAFS